MDFSKLIIMNTNLEYFKFFDQVEFGVSSKCTEVCTIYTYC